MCLYRTDVKIDAKLLKSYRHIEEVARGNNIAMEKRARASHSARLAFKSRFCCMTLGTSLDLSELPFHHSYKGDTLVSVL